MDPQKRVDSRPPSPVSRSGKPTRQHVADESMTYVSPAEVAEMLGISKRNVFRMKAEGKLPPYDFESKQTKRWQVTTIRVWFGQMTQ